MTDFSALTTLQVGGPAATLVQSRRREELIGNMVGSNPADTLIIGAGSNIVVSDQGWPGTTLRIAGGAIGHRFINDQTAVEFTVDAGVTWDAFVEATIAVGATGVELLSGIPGTVGAAPVQNIAAYGQQVSTVIHSVSVFDRATLQLDTLAGDACGFGYRTSAFKTDWAQTKVITHVAFRLDLAAHRPPEASSYGDLAGWFAERGDDPCDVAARRRGVLAVRRSKSMVLDPTDPMSRSAGSFFMNPMVDAAFADSLIDTFAAKGLSVTYLEGQRAQHPDDTARRVPAALVLRAAGFNPGDRWGPVQLSDHHVLAIVTHDGATADDVWQLSHLIRTRVTQETGVTLTPEVRFVGAFNDPEPTAFTARHPFTAGTSQPDWLDKH